MNLKRKLTDDTFSSFFLIKDSKKVKFVKINKNGFYIMNEEVIKCHLNVKRTSSIKCIYSNNMNTKL